MKTSMITRIGVAIIEISASEVTCSRVDGSGAEIASTFFQSFSQCRERQQDKEISTIAFLPLLSCFVCQGDHRNPKTMNETNGLQEKESVAE